MLTIRRGSSVTWRMTFRQAGAGSPPVNLTGGTWGIAESTFQQLPTLVSVNPSEGQAEVRWSAEQTRHMRPARRKLRLKFTNQAGQVIVFPDIWVTVE